MFAKRKLLGVTTFAAAAVALVATPALAGAIQPIGWGNGTFSSLGMTCNAGHQHYANGNIYMSVCLNISGSNRQAAVVVSNRAPAGSGISVSASTRIQNADGSVIVDCGAKRLDGGTAATCFGAVSTTTATSYGTVDVYTGGSWGHTLTEGGPTA